MGWQDELKRQIADGHVVFRLKIGEPARSVALNIMGSANDRPVAGLPAGELLILGFDNVLDFERVPGGERLWEMSAVLSRLPLHPYVRHVPGDGPVYLVPPYRLADFSVIPDRPAEAEPESVTWRDRPPLL